MMAPQEYSVAAKKQYTDLFKAKKKKKRKKKSVSHPEFKKTSMYLNKHPFQHDARSAGNYQC
jgi:hypothetical protein